MRNRELHDALRAFALETAALLSEDLERGAEIEFDLDEGSRRGGADALPLPAADGEVRRRPLAAPARPAELRPRPRRARVRRRGLSARSTGCAARRPSRRCARCSSGSTRTRPTSSFPEERFERVYGEVERTLYERSQSGDRARARPRADPRLRPRRSRRRPGARPRRHDRRARRRALERLRRRSRRRSPRAQRLDRPDARREPRRRAAAERGARALPAPRDRPEAVEAGRRGAVGRSAGGGPARASGSRSRSSRPASRAASRGCSPRARTPTCASSSRRSIAPVRQARSPGRCRASRWAAVARRESEALSDYLLGLRALLERGTDCASGRAWRCASRCSAPRRASGAASSAASSSPRRSSAS